MLKKSLFLISMTAAIGLPYLITSSTDWLSSLGVTSTAASKDGKSAPAPAKTGSQPLAALEREGPLKLESLSAPRAIEGFGAHDLGEVLQFDGTPAWVMARWPRVTAGLAELDLQGYRVPLVTGTGEDDLAGSLTYYFDKSQRVQWISFHGTTGDPRKLVTLVTSRYKFLRQEANDPSLFLYQVKWNGKPLSELRIRAARVVRANQPHTRFEVDLAMKRP